MAEFPFASHSVRAVSVAIAVVLAHPKLVVTECSDSSGFEGKLGGGLVLTSPDHQPGTAIWFRTQEGSKECLALGVRTSVGICWHNAAEHGCLV